jgi:hypothetical protein
VHQPGIAEKPVLSIALCPAREGAIAFACGSEVCFATLPQWGFGHFVVRNRYTMHLATVGIVAWAGSEDAQSLISVDSDRMCHVLEVPADFVALYQP